MNPQIRVLSALLLALAACTTAPVAPPDWTPGERVSRLERAAADPSAAPAELARAAVTGWLVTGDAEKATRLLDRALTKNPSEPLALFGRERLAHDRLDDAASADAALATLKGTPQALFAEIAARRLEELTQISPALDQKIIDVLGPLARGSRPGLEGRAALLAREALVNALDGRNEDAQGLALRRAMGQPDAWTLVGPLSAWRIRDFDSASPFDEAGHVLKASYPSPGGDVAPRVIPTPSGTLSLDGETWRGDGFEALVDLEVRQGGEHLVSLEGAGMARVIIDGVVVLRRSTYPDRAPARSWGGVALAKGRHRLRVHFTRSESSSLALAVARADGAPTEIVWTAPTAGSVVPDGIAEIRAAPMGAPDLAEQLTAADPGDPLSWFLRLHAVYVDDPEWTRHHVAQLVATAGESVPVRLLRADLLGSDPDLPRANAIGLVSKDLDAVLTREPDHIRANILRFNGEQSDKRFDEAAARLSKLVRILGEKDARLLVTRARFAAERDDESAARRLSEAALAADPGRCDAADFRFDIARRDNEVAVVDRLLPLLAVCAGGLSSNATVQRHRGHPELARPFLERIVARAPASASARRALSYLLVAMGDPVGAAAALTPLVAQWPRRADTVERLSELAELTGDAAQASELRARALTIDASDLSLARAVALETRGEVLSWAARDGLAAIAAFRASGFRSNAPAIQVLDIGAIEVSADGSTTERVHSIVQVLDKRGIDRYGEVNLPGDAQALLVRTVKASGEILDAEIISGKDAISLPNLEPGDFVEHEYLRASAARPASMPGFQGGQFFFQGGDVPFFESTYQVRAPASLGLEIDAGALADARPPVREGDWLHFTYTRRESEAFIREPLAVSDGEVLPWVELGSGARQVDAIRQLSDWVLLRARPTGEVREVVRGLASLPPIERVPAIVDRLRDLVRGDAPGNDFSDSAATVLARGRGNRLLALKAALTAAGIKSHLVVARAFSANPHPFRFPRGDLYGTALLRIEPEGSAPVWMDFTLRKAPLGALPPGLSEADAFVVPEPGEEVQRITLPKVDPAVDRTDAKMALTLEADGTLSGVVTQIAYGFDAAGLRRRLEQVNESELRKQQERMLGGIFRGVVLTDLAIEDSGDPAKPLIARSTIRVPRYGLRADGTLALPAHFGAQQLGLRFLGRADRRTPMLLRQAEITRANIRLTLAPGLTLAAPTPVDVQSAFGRFRATWLLTGRDLSLDEEMLLERGRVSPEQYLAFKSFASSVDSAQAREIPVTR